MQEGENTVPVVPKSSKRPYVKRKEELLDKTLEQVQGILKEVADQIKVLQNKKDRSAEESVSLKELINKRVRIYKRMRDLGYNAREIRSKNAAEKKAVEPKVEETKPETPPAN